MGCDIHFFLEKKFDKDWVMLNGEIDSWCSDNYFNPFNRAYEWFNHLAGVRGMGPATPKGLPADVSVAAEYLTRDYHSHTHFSLKEFDKLYKKFVKTINKNPDIYFFKCELPKCPPSTYFFNVDKEDYKHYRIVIAFDS